MLGFIIPDTSTIPTTTTTTTAKPKDGSTFNNIASGIASLFSSAAPIVQAVTKPGNGAPGYNPLLPPSSAFNPPTPPPAGEVKKSNALKYGIIAVGALGATFLAYKVVTRKKKALSGAGLQLQNGGLGGAKKKRTRKRKK